MIYSHVMKFPPVVADENVPGVSPLGAISLTATSHNMENSKDAHVCEHCKSKAAFRSHRKNFLEFLRTKFTGKVPFRCAKCHRRYWKSVDPRDI
jgi:uncharacterized protein with PIN domain